MEISVTVYSSCSKAAKYRRAQFFLACLMVEAVAVTTSPETPWVTHGTVGIHGLMDGGMALGQKPEEQVTKSLFE